MLGDNFFVIGLSTPVDLAILSRNPLYFLGSVTLVVTLGLVIILRDPFSIDFNTSLVLVTFVVILFDLVFTMLPDLDGFIVVFVPGVCCFIISLLLEISPGLRLITIFPSPEIFFVLFSALLQSLPVIICVPL